MPSRLALAWQANLAPTHKNGFGQMCHHTVLEWLVKAGFGKKKNVLKILMPKEGQVPVNPATICSRLLVRKTDTPVNQDTASVWLGYSGMLVGFYQGQVYQHSMVTLNGTHLAGTNNVGIGGALLYDRVRWEDLPWSNDGETVGANNYKMFVVNPDQFPIRLKQEL
ncbi:MAG: hypothetical protein JRE58_04905 [Deltaproteobacteria bacterium]|nr:hypothetical protein [Deltaproteobacteria bacterium]